MTVHVPNNEAPNAPSQDKQQTLLKLLQIEPDDLVGLVRATGWGESNTRMALLQLTVDRQVTCCNFSGRRVYYAAPNSASQGAAQ